MTEYIVAAAALGVPTGKENPLTRLPDVVRFVRGEVVDSEKFDTDAGRNKIERLLKQGALRDPEDIPQEAKVAYASDFDIPLDRDPGGARTEQVGVVRLPGDDIEDDDEDDDSEPPRFAEPTGSQAGVPVTTGPASQEVQTPPASTPAETVSDEPDADSADESVPTPPSRGASTAVWQQYANQIGLEVPPDAGRTEIQEAYDTKYGQA